MIYLVKARNIDDTATEWQFSDGPSAARGSSADYTSLDAGLRAHSREEGVALDVTEADLTPEEMMLVNSYNFKVMRDPRPAEAENLIADSFTRQAARKFLGEENAPPASADPYPVAEEPSFHQRMMALTRVHTEQEVLSFVYDAAYEMGVIGELLDKVEETMAPPKKPETPVQKILRLCDEGTQAHGDEFYASIREAAEAL